MQSIKPNLSSYKMPRDTRHPDTRSLHTPTRMSAPMPTPYTPRQGFAESIKHGLGVGFSAGIGSSLGHTLINSLFNRKMSNETPAGEKPPQPCADQRNAFDTCLLTHAPDSYCMSEKAAFKTCLDNA